jgi:hypothetical protein
MGFGKAMKSLGEAPEIRLVEGAMRAIACGRKKCYARDEYENSSESRLHASSGLLP